MGDSFSAELSDSTADIPIRPFRAVYELGAATAACGVRGAGRAGPLSHVVFRTSGSPPGYGYSRRCSLRSCIQ
jgi:hypothetical protein